MFADIYGALIIILFEIVVAIFMLVSRVPRSIEREVWNVVQEMATGRQIPRERERFLFAAIFFAICESWWLRGVWVFCSCFVLLSAVPPSHVHAVDAIHIPWLLASTERHPLMNALLDA